MLLSQLVHSYVHGDVVPWERLEGGVAREVAREGGPCHPAPEVPAQLAVPWFQVCEAEGGVSTGLLQCLKAVLLFGASDLLFCDEDSDQCLSLGKGCATLLVVLGTMIFYAEPANAAPKDSQNGGEDKAGKIQAKMQDNTGNSDESGSATAGRKRSLQTPLL